MKQMLLRLPNHSLENDRLVFNAWYETGSLKRAQDKLSRDGVVSTRKKPYSIPGVRLAASRYMIDNYVEAKQKLMDMYRKNGYIVEEQYIEQYLISRAVQTLETQERVKFWLVEHDLLEKHKTFIASLIAV